MTRFRISDVLKGRLDTFSALIATLMSKYTYLYAQLTMVVCLLIIACTENIDFM